MPRPETGHRTTVPSGPSRVLALQSTAGNQAVGTLLFRQAAAVGPRPVSKPVPGLPEDVLVRVEEQLASGSAAGAQSAIDLVVGVLAGRGDLDLALVDGRRMRFDPALTDEGHTQQWAKPVRGGFRPLPSTVRIGPPALANASWLYTAITHEYQHVVSFQTPRSDPFKEVDAYLFNIERADEAGLDGGEVLELWGRLRDEWADIPDALRPGHQERYDAAAATVRRIAGTTALPAPAPAVPVQRAPDDTCTVNQTMLVHAGTPGTDRCVTEDDPEFRANYVDNNIVRATGLCQPGTTWENIDHARVPQIQLTYQDGRQLVIAVSDVPLVLSEARKRTSGVTALRPLARYEKRADGFIYPIRTVGDSGYVAYGDAANIVSLRAGLHAAVDDMKGLFLLVELAAIFSGEIAQLGGVASLSASNEGGLFEFSPRKAKAVGGEPPAPRTAPREPGEAPRTTPHTDQENPKSSTGRIGAGSRSRQGDEPGPKQPKLKRTEPKAGKDSEKAPDREVTARRGSDEKEQTAAERDWDKAQAEANRQEEGKDKPTRTEHGALREQERGALTDKERGALANVEARVQGDGNTAKVVRQTGGKYLVHITTKDGQTVTLMRDLSKSDLAGLSERYQWTPPWTN